MGNYEFGMFDDEQKEVTIKKGRAEGKSECIVPTRENILKVVDEFGRKNCSCFRFSIGKLYYGRKNCQWCDLMAKVGLI